MIQNSTSTQSFDQQFSNIKEIAGVKTVELIPKRSIGNPVVYCLGWTGTIEGCRSYYKNFYDRNKHVLSIQYPPQEPDFDKNDIPLGFSGFGFQSALAFIKLLKERDIKKIDLVGHSEGGTIALMINALLPAVGADADNIVLVNSAGFGNTTPEEMHIRVLQMLKHEIMRIWTRRELFRNMSGIILDGSKAFITNPNIVKEGEAVTEVDMQQLLSSPFRRNQHVAVIQTTDDPVVKVAEVTRDVLQVQEINRAERIEALREVLPDIPNDEVSKRNIEDAADELDIPRRNAPLIVFLPGGHFLHGLYPKTYVPLVVDLLDYFRTGTLPRPFVVHDDNTIAESG